MLEINPKNTLMWSRLGSCGAFGAAAMELAKNDETLAILTADLCFYSGLSRVQQEFPEKIYNVGIAEQNMVGVAAGMAKEGMNVFATTYATFATTRCCDQVRVNMGYMQLPVKLIGLTAGLCVGILGGTHISCEDMAIMRSIPNIVVLSPADCTETVKATLVAAKLDKPVYIRLTGAMGNPIVYKDDYDFEIGKAIKLRDYGNDITIIATGTMVSKSLKIADKLNDEKIHCSVYDMHTIKPLDKDAVKQVLGSKLIVTIEEHSVIGGLGSAVAEEIARYTEKQNFLSLGITDSFAHAADYNYLLKSYGLDDDSLYQSVSEKYKNILRCAGGGYNSIVFYNAPTFRSVA